MFPPPRDWSPSREGDNLQRAEPLPSCSTRPPLPKDTGRRYRWTSSSSSSTLWANQLVAEPAKPAQQRFFADKVVVGPVRGKAVGLKWLPRNSMMEVDEYTEASGMADSMPCTSLGPPTTCPGLPPAPHSGSATGNSASSLTLASGMAQVPAVEAFVYCDHQEAPNILSMLATFRSDNSMCDVELQVDGSSIYAHRCVLAAAIPYFRSMFNSLMLETKMKKIVINDITYDSLRLLVDFVYTSTIRIDSDNVQNLLFAASILQMDNVCLACQRFLSRFLTTSNCLMIRQFAEQHNCVDLMENTDDFAVEHFSAIRKMDDFATIPFNHLRDLLRRNDLNISSEEEVFEAVVTWCAADEATRLKHFHELLCLVLLPQLQFRYILNTVKTHPYVQGNRDSSEFLSEAVLEMLRPLQDRACSVEAAYMEESCGQYAATPLPVERPLMYLQKPRARSRPRKSCAGVIFCAGGRGTAGDPFRSVEAYDWRKNRWVNVPEMTLQRRHVGVVSVMGNLYAIGGHDGQTHLDSAEVFDPSVGCWRAIAPMNTRRRGIAVAALGNAIFAVGGLDDQTCFNTVERYDIMEDTWTEVAKMYVMRGGVGVTALGKLLFAVGGNDGTSSLDSCECYDPLLNKWMNIQPMNYRRAGAGVCVLDGFLYALGGFDDNAPLSTCERYNISLNKWECLPNMKSARGGVGVAAMGGLLYAIGGHDGSRYLNTVECYDPVTGLWEPVAEIKECRAGAGVAWADCNISQLSRHMQDSGCAPSAGSQCI